VGCPCDAAAPCDQPTLLSTTQQPSDAQGMDFLCADCGGTSDYGLTMVAGFLLAALLIACRRARRPRILTLGHLRLCRLQPND